MKLVTSLQMRDLDRRMIEECKITPFRLMEIAGSNAAYLILALLQKMCLVKRVILFAGRGNNGGDALVCARVLEDHGVRTRTLILAKSQDIQNGPLYNLRKLLTRTTDIHFVNDIEEIERLIAQSQCSPIAVDGLLGTGSRLPLQGVFEQVVRKINAMRYSLVVSLDLPTGLDADIGVIKGECIRADYTVTMGLAKKGFVNALDHIGKLHIVDLGIPHKFLSEISSAERLLTLEELQLDQKRLKTVHKGSFGKLFILAGSRGMTGAAILTARSALRAGSGLVELGVPESLNHIYELSLKEALTVVLPDEGSSYIGEKNLDQILQSLKKAQACVLGPGLSQQDDVRCLVHHLIEKIEVPTVLDADALNVLEGQVELLKKKKVPFIVTPHPGEMARLEACTVKEIQANRIERALNFASRYDVIVVLKGAGTVIASPAGQVFVNVTGNPGMASGGMGDVLSGLIGGLLAQGMKPIEAAKLGVFVHGKCADQTADYLKAERGILASEVLDQIPGVLNEQGTAFTSMRWGGYL